MGLTVFLKMIPWLVYLLVAYHFLAYISRHSIALYCRRGKGAGDKNRLRVFLQNLEDVDLEGGYRLRIEVSHKVALRNTAIRAGPKNIMEDNAGLQDGVWDVYFDSLPALDTWLFELDEPDKECTVKVKLQPTPSSLREEHKDAVQIDADLGVAEFLRVRSAPKLATDSLVLKDDQSWAVAGSYSTPRWATTFWLVAIAVAGYFLAIATFAPGQCSGPAMAFASCSLARFQEYAGWVDLAYVAALLLAAILYRLAASRRPIPIAQGYLERTITRRYEARSESPPA